MFDKLLSIIYNSHAKSFDDVCDLLTECVNVDADFICTLRQIGMIPENIAHDSTEEKLFSKASDLILSRTFRELGLKSTVIKTRANAADVVAESKFYNYSLVADAKSFRLSRTAKNQKNFKVSALSSWRNDNDYAVLCAPYFQYPAKNSQIYAQALVNNVCLITWEHMAFMIENGIRESENIKLSMLWSFSENLSHNVAVSDMKKNLLSDFNAFLIDFLKINSKILATSLNAQIDARILANINFSFKSPNFHKRR